VATTVWLRVSVVAHKAGEPHLGSAHVLSFEATVVVYQVNNYADYAYTYVGAVWARINGVKVGVYWGPRISAGYRAYMYAASTYVDAGGPARQE